MQRLWLQSMTQGPSATVSPACARGRNGGPGDAAVCRSESDWLVGINGTRAMTAFNSKTGGFHLTTVGRVQTRRWPSSSSARSKIREFKPRDYWEVEAEFSPRRRLQPASGSTKASKGKNDDETRPRRPPGESPAPKAIRAATWANSAKVSEAFQAGNPPVTRCSSI